MRYSVDTNVLVDAWYTWYTPESHPTFWERIETLASDGHLKISDTVIWELEEVEDDALTKWCKDRSDILVISSDEQIQACVRQIGRDYNNFIALQRGSKNYADPFVICLAKQFDECAVVTHEDATGNLKGPKVPDVARNEGLEVVRLPHVVRAEGWVFR